MVRAWPAKDDTNLRKSEAYRRYYDGLAVSFKHDETRVGPHGLAGVTHNRAVTVKDAFDIDPLQ